MKGKTTTTRSPKTVNKPGTKTTTKTADGGQLYVRGGAGTRGSYVKPKTASDRYMDRDRGPTTKNPKIARGLEEATYLAMSPKDKDNARFAKKMGKGKESYANTMNALTRERGDQKKR
jgi:hypothetical protein